MPEAKAERKIAWEMVPKAISRVGSRISQKTAIYFVDSFLTQIREFLKRPRMLR